MDHVAIGLEEGDIITQIDGIDINKMTELREYLYGKKPGDKVVLSVEDGESKELEIVLRKRRMKKILQNLDFSSKYCIIIR